MLDTSDRLVMNRDKRIFGKVTLNFLGHTASKLHGITHPSCSTDYRTSENYMTVYYNTKTKKSDCSYSVINH